MKYKIYIFILIIAIYFFPVKTFGFFAVPDQRIHSMPFGAQRNNADVRVFPIIPGDNKLLQPAAISESKNNSSSEIVYFFSNADISWLISLSAIIIAIIIFALLKFIKMI